MQLGIIIIRLGDWQGFKSSRKLAGSGCDPWSEALRATSSTSHTAKQQIGLNRLLHVCFRQTLSWSASVCLRVSLSFALSSSPFSPPPFLPPPVMFPRSFDRGMRLFGSAEATSAGLPGWLASCLPVCQSVSSCLPVCCLPVWLAVHLSISPSLCLSLSLSLSLSLPH